MAKPRTNAMKRSFSYKSAKIWNSLPSELRDLTISDGNFKQQLRFYVKENYSILKNYISS